MIDQSLVCYSQANPSVAGRDVVLCLHGYGSTPQAVAPFFRSLPEDALGVALPGVFPMDDGQRGWFLLDYVLNHDFARITDAAGQIFDWQATHLAGARSIHLAGHSQGMAMATTLYRLRPQGYATIAGLSGFVLDNELLNLTDPTEQIPCFWGRDKLDLVINPEAVSFTADWVRRHTYCTVRTYDEATHAITEAQLRDLRAFWGYYLSDPSRH
ncbi:phospholipase/carboxylesterase [Glutamicibacter endophyticus]